MKKNVSFVSGFFILMLGLSNVIFPSSQNDTRFLFQDLEGIERIALSVQSRDLLERYGFAVSPGDGRELFDVYIQAKNRNQPIFLTTDVVLHTCHLFFDYLLRILEIEKLHADVVELTDRMIALSQDQYKEAKDENVRMAARLNVGFFSVAKKIFMPEFDPGLGLKKLVEKEIANIDSHKGIEFRSLLSYIDNPTLFKTPYAYEDFSQYVPRGHYTRNETFEKYFKAMMWYGRIDFNLRPGNEDQPILHGRKMTLQALLITDALMSDPQAYDLWKKIYEPTVYFVGKTDDLSVDDYGKLADEIFPSEGSVDRYWRENELSQFIAKALELRLPRVLSGAAFVEDGEFTDTTKGFRFMGQRFIPDSAMFQQLVYGRKKDEVILKYAGNGKPFTMEVIPAAGPVRAFPRGLDVMAVLGSERALEILEGEGDTEYTHYYDQLRMLREEFSTISPEGWQRNLYWRWLYCLLPLLEERSEITVPRFMKNEFWLDKELQTALGSWTELRHDTILYAKQSYTMFTRTRPPQPELTYGYVEPYPEVYLRIKEMMADLRKNLEIWIMDIPGIDGKMRGFEEVLDRLSAISEKELSAIALTEEDYAYIWNIGQTLLSLKQFPSQIMEKITSGTDERVDIIADVHTDLNTKQVLEEGVGSPFNIYVVVEDSKGQRLCRGAVFSYYEFKHPMDDRLTDEKWQGMGKEGNRPDQPPWIKNFITEF